MGLGWRAERSCFLFPTFYIFEQLLLEKGGADLESR